MKVEGLTRHDHSHDHYQCDAQHFLLLASYHHHGLSSVSPCLLFTETMLQELTYT
jgi:hypothetical protein